MKNLDQQSKKSEYFELLIVLSLSIFAGTLFFTDRRATVFDAIAAGVLMAWRYIFKREAQRSLPAPLIIWAVLYILSCFVGAIMSNDINWELAEFRKRYIHFIIAWLLLMTPLSDKYRKIVITFYFIAGAIGGIVGILQYYGIMGQHWSRSHGFSAHPILYAALLALVCGSAMIMLFLYKGDLYQTKSERFFLLFIILTTFLGILVSESRGVWLALVIACVMTLFLYARHDHRKGIILCISFIGICILIFAFSSVAKKRAMSIVTTIFTENEAGSTGNRIELWKGSLLIFKQHPLLGVGTGNFQSSIEGLVHEKRIKEMPFKMHAHSIYFHALATRGIIGLVLTIGFYLSLLKYGINEVLSDYRQVGGYIISLSVMLTLIGGLTENNIEITKYVAAFCFTIGLIGPYGASKLKSNV